MSVSENWTRCRTVNSVGMGGLYSTGTRDEGQTPFAKSPSRNPPPAYREREPECRQRERRAVAFVHLGERWESIGSLSSPTPAGGTSDPSATVDRPIACLSWRSCDVRSSSAVHGHLRTD